MAKGYIIFVLHAHLPYIKHPECDFFLEEGWLYEAISETYIPLLDMFSRLIEDKVEFSITLSVSPTLLEMFDDALLRERFIDRIERLIELLEYEIKRAKKSPLRYNLALLYKEHLRKTLRLYVGSYKKDLVSALRVLARTGHIELITTSATHAYLPNLAPLPYAVHSQIGFGLEEFKKRFKFKGKGFWLPECGYYKGLDEILRGFEIKYTITESHSILSPFGVYKPLRTPSGLYVFGRDPLSSKEVWSSKEGYPRESCYRDFHKDISYSLPERYVKRFIHPDGIRIPTGIKYLDIEGRTYEPKRALRQAGLHALDFIKKKEVFSGSLSFKPLITAPFDAELFGHWWHEGVFWLESVLRGLKNSTLRAVTASDYLRNNKGFYLGEPLPSSWGRGGYGYTWCSEKNNWAISYIHKATSTLPSLIDRYGNREGLHRRALIQALREALLMQSSDWLFLIEYATAPHYAEKRLKGHIENFMRIKDMLYSGNIDEEFISNLEAQSPRFSSIGRVFFRGGVSRMDKTLKMQGTHQRHN